jgi:hypothetical protein
MLNFFLLHRNIGFWSQQRDHRGAARDQGRPLQ